MSGKEKPHLPDLIAVNGRHVMTEEACLKRHGSTGNLLKAVLAAIVTVVTVASGLTLDSVRQASDERKANAEAIIKLQVEGQNDRTRLEQALTELKAQREKDSDKLDAILLSLAGIRTRMSKVEGGTP